MCWGTFVSSQKFAFPIFLLFSYGLYEIHLHLSLVLLSISLLYTCFSNWFRYFQIYWIHHHLTFSHSPEGVSAEVLVLFTSFALPYQNLFGYLLYLHPESIQPLLKVLSKPPLQLRNLRGIIHCIFFLKKQKCFCFVLTFQCFFFYMFFLFRELTLAIIFIIGSMMAIYWEVIGSLEFLDFFIFQER